MSDFVLYGGLFVLALVAGAIDAVAGGGGLLTVPGLLAVGLDPVSVVATNKLQGMFGPLSATVHFWRHGRIRLSEHLLPAGAAWAGGVAGAASLSLADPELLKTLVPVLLIAVAVWVLFSPNLGEVPRRARVSAAVFALTLVPLVAAYDGFFGPGAGTFFALGAVSLLGVTLQEATVRAKLCNFASNLGALGFFVFSGHVVWAYGAAMILGTIIGGNLGARLILARGTGLIRPVLVVMSLAMSGKLLWQQGFIQRMLN